MRATSRYSPCERESRTRRATKHEILVQQLPMTKRTIKPSRRTIATKTILKMGCCRETFLDERHSTTLLPSAR